MTRYEKIMNIIELSKCHMTLSTKDAITMGEQFGGYISFVDETDAAVQWFSLHYTPSEIMRNNPNNSIIVEPWGAFEKRITNQ